MSFWFRRRDKLGRGHYFSVSLPTLLVIAVMGILIALILPLVQALREALR